MPQLGCAAVTLTTLGLHKHRREILVNGVLQTDMHTDHTQRYNHIHTDHTRRYTDKLVVNLISSLLYAPTRVLQQIQSIYTFLACTTTSV